MFDAKYAFLLLQQVVKILSAKNGNRFQNGGFINESISKTVAG